MNELTKIYRRRLGVPWHLRHRPSPASLAAALAEVVRQHPHLNLAEAEARARARLASFAHKERDIVPKLLVIAVLIIALLCFFVGRATAQVDIVKTQNGATPLKTHAAPMTIKCDGTGATCTDDGKTLTITATGGTGGGSGLADPGANGIVKRTALNTTAAAVAGTDYVLPSGNVATATALAANPTDCSAGQYATTIDASGNLTCATVAFSQLSGSVAASQMPALTGDATSSAGSVATTVGKVNGVSYPAAPSTDTVPVVTAANTITYKALPACTVAATSKLLYDTSTHAFSCGTDQSAAGASVALIANGTASLPSTTINSGSCATTVTVAATGTATTDTIT